MQHVAIDFEHLRIAKFNQFVHPVMGYNFHWSPVDWDVIFRQDTVQQLSGAQTEESWVFNLPLQFCLLLSMNQISGRDIHGTPLLTSKSLSIFCCFFLLYPLYSIYYSFEFIKGDLFLEGNFTLILSTEKCAQSVFSTLSHFLRIE